MKWTPQIDGILKHLCEQGQTFGEVAAALTKLGYKCSRNAIAGRRHRLLGKGEVVMKPVTLRKGRPRKEKTVAVVKKPVAVPPTVPVAHLDDAKIKGVEYLKNEHGCKAILDRRGNDFLPLCCGRPRTHDGYGNLKSYCAEHHARYSHSIPRKQYG